MVSELLLVGAATEQVKPCVHCFGLIGLDGVVDDTQGCSNVNLNRYGWLGMTHFNEQVMFWD